MRGHRVDIQMVDTFAFVKNRGRFASDLKIRNHAVAFVFDITNADTFHKLEEAFLYLRDLHSSSLESIEGLVIGTKADAEMSREVPQQHAEKWAAERNLPYLECSTVSGFNVKLAFECLCAQALKCASGDVLFNVAKECAAVMADGGSSISRPDQQPVFDGKALPYSAFEEYMEVRRGKTGAWKRYYVVLDPVRSTILLFKDKFQARSNMDPVFAIDPTHSEEEMSSVVTAVVKSLNAKGNEIRWRFRSEHPLAQDEVVRFVRSIVRHRDPSTPRAISALMQSPETSPPYRVGSTNKRQRSNPIALAASPHRSTEDSPLIPRSFTNGGTGNSMRLPSSFGYGASGDYM